MKKYKITGESKLVDGVTVHRIRALRKFTAADGSVVEAGALGGWIEREDNLSQDVSIWDAKAAAAWVADNAAVYGKAVVKGQALVRGEARVFGGATVRARAVIGGTARVCGTATVWDARVDGDSLVDGATVFGDCRVGGRSIVRKFAHVYGRAVVDGDAVVEGPRTTVDGYAVVRGHANVRSGAIVDGGAVVDGDAIVDGTHLRGEAAPAADAIREALSRLIACEHKIVEANPDYDMGTIGRELVMDVERTLIRACCRTESGRKATDSLYCDVTGIGCVANALDGLDEAARRKEVKFGAVRDCPEAGLYAAAAREPRIKSAVRARLAEVGRDVRLRDLPAEEQAAWRAKTRAEKRAANQAAAEKAEADGITLG